MVEDIKGVVGGAVSAGKEAILGRLSSPVLGPFLLTWAFFNYRLFFVLFSGEKLVDRFKLVDDLTIPKKEWLWSQGLFWPACATAAYILLLPWVVEGVHRWNLMMKRRIRKAELESSGEEVLTLPASKIIREQIASQKIAISDLAELERVARICGLGWRAMARSGSDIDANHREHALFEFLTSTSFGVRDNDMATGVTGTLALDGEGNASLDSPFINGSRSVRSWAIMGSEVVLKASNGAEIGRLVFRPELGGALNGQIGNDRVFVSSKEFESWG